MKKTILGLLASALILTILSCTKNTRVAVENDNQKNTDTITIDDHHNAENALDYDGIYLGILPCADCEGIKTTIYINRDKTYTLKQVYINKNAQVIEEKGTYTWDKSGTIISLKPNTNNEKGMKLFVAENALYILDQSGKRITGPLADHYELTKDNYALLNKKWRIFEMYGKPFKPETTSKKEGYITFDEDENRVIASAGCNTMSGDFNILPKNKLEFGVFMSTAMACENMQDEGKLGKILSETKKFNVNNDELTLINKNQETIAKLKIPMH